MERSVWEQLGDHHDADDVVWGMAYRIEPSKVESVKEYLNIREINGYSIHFVDVHQADSIVAPIKAIVYIGTPDNPQFVPRNGVPEEADLAKHIYDSRGPSGENKEYLYELYHALEELCPESKDNHVKSLFRKVAIQEAINRVNSHGTAAELSPTEKRDAPTDIDIDIEMIG